MNSVNLIGRLTKDPTTRKSQSGSSVANFTLAVERFAGGEKKTDFINCAAFGKQADYIEQYISKGYKMAVSGVIQTGSYQDKDGKTVNTVSVACSSVENLEPRVNTPKTENNAPQAYNEPTNDDFEPALNISPDDLPF